jgi:hypothetical protein
VHLSGPRLTCVVLCRALCIDGKLHAPGALRLLSMDLAETLLSRGCVKRWRASVW